MNSREVNFDGLVGPTHHYAGLAFGNLASMKHAREISNPKAAALQGLKKMQILMALGIPQAVLPPHERPNLPFLRSLGFRGTDIQILEKVKEASPALFYAAYSASSMWTANAATVSPSADTQDGRLHITPANLMSYFHRSLETELNLHIFKTIFNDQALFEVHPPLPAHPVFADEGAANHNRICLNYGEPGLELFVYGRSDVEVHQHKPLHYPARQSLEASQALARQHQLLDSRILFLKQNPEVIDRGVFHNDVISVANENVFLSHEWAFLEGKKVYAKLQERVSFPMHFITVPSSELTVEEAVECYLFNSQIVTLPNGSMTLIAPEECRTHARAQPVIQRILGENNPIQQCEFVDCHESMRNGGGPACLRLRVVLTEEQERALNPAVFLNQKQYQVLLNWVNRYYRSELSEADLLDPQLIQESQAALNELTQILNLGSLYTFQR